MVIHLSKLNEIWGEPVCSNSTYLENPIARVVTDSREFRKGDFFVPLIGHHFNGHDFLPEIFKLGAQATIVSEYFAYLVPDGLLHWIVKDTLLAYQQLALLHRRDLNLPIVAVTGSAGKTTTRELIRSSLSSIGSVLASFDNNNNDIGVPATLLKGNLSHAVMVVEMGMRGPGEIERLSFCTEPDIAVITNIGSAHIGKLGSLTDIANAKCEITSYLKPSGLVVIPAGDFILEEALKKKWRGRVVRVKLNKISSCNEIDSTYSSLVDSDLEATYDFITNTLCFEGQICSVPLSGKHNALNMLLAIAVAKEFNVPIDLLKELKISMPSGRNRRIQFHDFIVLDETYNSSPEAVIASLEMLVNEPGRHFAVLGTMLELGKYSLDLHRKVAEAVVDFGLDGLVIVSEGSEGKVMAEAAKSLAKIEIVSSPEEAFVPLKNWLESGDIVLLKASRSIQLERLMPLLATL